MKRLGLLAAFGVFWIGCKGAEDLATTAGEGAPASFADVQAILNPKCVMCHGEKGKEDLDLRSHASIMKGSEHGQVVVAGDAANSKIVKAVRGQGMKQMPLNSNPLSEKEIKTIESWINAGAKP